MRLTMVADLILASSLLLACGGGTPPPKDESDAVEHGSPKTDNASSESAANKEAPATSSEAASAPTAKSSSGDLVAPTGDDPWMAPHQMPSSDVIKTMRGAKGKVNACWAAARKRDPSVSGDVKLKFVITHEGSVRVWKNNDSSCTDGEAINCVGELIKSLKFPTQKSPGDAWGTFDINFGG